MPAKQTAPRKCLVYVGIASDEAGFIGDYPITKLAGTPELAIKRLATLGVRAERELRREANKIARGISSGDLVVGDEYTLVRQIFQVPRKSEELDDEPELIADDSLRTSFDSDGTWRITKTTADLELSKADIFELAEELKAARARPQP